MLHCAVHSSPSRKPVSAQGILMPLLVALVRRLHRSLFKGSALVALKTRMLSLCNLHCKGKCSWPFNTICSRERHVALHRLGRLHYLALFPPRLPFNFSFNCWARANGRAPDVQVTTLAGTGKAADSEVDLVETVPFLQLALDLPPRRLFEDVMQKNIIPQVRSFYW